ncbi:MAG: CoA pyrophosphatase [Bacteroidota bacterium]
MSIQALAQQLTLQLQQPLPGRSAQYKMAHAIRQKTFPVPDNARKACVVLLLYPKNGTTHIVLIERMPSKHKDDRHSGQISFPGGKLEPDDPSLKAGALRETEEEVGVPPEQIQILGALSQLYIPVSNFLVFPFVGYTDEAPHFIRQASEVKSIIETPLSLLLDPRTLQHTDIPIKEGVLKGVPFFNVFGHTVWGATAMMLSEFLHLVEAVQLPKNS